MKEKIIICAIAALIGAVIKFVSAASKSKVTDIINALIGIFILLTLFSISKQKISLPSLTNGEVCTDYETISREMMRKIYFSAEKDIEEIISEEIFSRFGIAPIQCDILINEEELTIEKAELIFSSKDKLISGYEIKSYLKEKYEMDIEVTII